MVLSKNTVTYRLDKLSKESPDFEVFVSYDEANKRQAVKMSEFMSLCLRFAAILKKEGVLPGDYVATTVPLSIEATVITYGIILAGAMVTSLEQTFYNAEGLLQCMEKVKTRFLITTDEPVDHVLKFFTPSITSGHTESTAEVSFKRLPWLKKLIKVGRSGKGKSSFLDMLRSCKEEYYYEQVHGKMGSFIHFTTGTPTVYLKMTEISHENLVNLSDSMKKMNAHNYPKMIYTNPFFWVSSCPFDMFQCTTRVIPDKWSPIKDYPAMLYRMIKTEKIEFADIQPVDAIGVIKIWRQKDDTSKPLLKLHTIMGMPATRTMLKQFQEWAGHINLIYGSHECGACFLNQFPVSHIDNFTDFDCGMGLPGTVAKVVDENRKEVAPGVKGRLLLKTPGMMKGYPGDPVKTNSMFDLESWFVTNDSAVITKDKHLFVGGRIDSIILHGEYMIYPVWIEEFVSPLPQVEKVVSVPVLDPVLFHAVGVCVILKPGTTLTKDDVIKQVASFIVPEKVFIFIPKHLLFFESFPLKENGEVDRSKLFDLVDAQING